MIYRGRSCDRCGEHQCPCRDLNVWDCGFWRPAADQRDQGRFSARWLIEDLLGGLRAVTLSGIPGEQIEVETDEVGVFASYRGHMLLEVEAE